MVIPSQNTYAPPKSTVADLAQEHEGGELASRLARLGAVTLDGILYSAAFGPSYVIAIPRYLADVGAAGRAGALQKLGLWRELAATGGWFYFGLAAALILLLVNAVLVQRNGQTIGKKLLGIKVVRKDGSRATLARIFWLRNFTNGLFTLVPVIGSIYGLIDPLLIFGDARRCCHDYLADTIVVRA
jgi:uncharacterized RDD family membrane protein YckC